MKILVNAMTAIICACLMAGTISGQSRAEDEAAIRRIVSLLQDGWNAGSGKDYAAVFDEDADYVIINGRHIKGRKEIEAGHQHIFDTIYKNSRISPAIQSVRFLSDTIALAHIEWQMKLAEGREGRAMNSLLLTKKNGQWSITAFHNTSVDPNRK
ncbi:MAG: SgcJ/EcaC family oxidoreductase [Blastocatellia bacterium]